MSARTQAKVLRALEESRITRVGGSRSVEVDVRVLSATNQDLEKESFRSDLLHRLNVIPIQMPPLRDRPEDIPLLVDHFVKQLAGGGSGPVRSRAAPSSCWPGSRSRATCANSGTWWNAS